jgi:Na+-transporting NADH:ubiquinone oxidoreductase subunit NqrF
VQVVVEYPPVQCADGADNKEILELFAGENLRRALLNRGIVMEDGKAGKCDFCGGKCTVKIDMGMPLMNPMSTTEEKIMKNNPKCRVSLLCRNFADQIIHFPFVHSQMHPKISCKTVVGYNMQEGNVRLKVNLNEWTAEDKKESSPFFSR